MKRLHYPLLGLLIVAILGVPAWYSLRAGAEPVPGVGANAVLRSKDNRSYVGGGPRVGK